MDWFLYDIGLRHERVKLLFSNKRKRNYGSLVLTKTVTQYLVYITK